MSHHKTRWRCCPICGERVHLDSMRSHVGGPECLLTFVSARGSKFADNTRGPRVLAALRALSDALDGKPEQPGEAG